jgi:hypothetical protein
VRRRLAAPLRFGVLAYKHFVALPDRAGFLRRVRAGEALAAPD